MDYNTVLKDFESDLKVAGRQYRRALGNRKEITNVVRLIPQCVYDNAVHGWHYAGKPTNLHFVLPWNVSVIKESQFLMENVGFEQFSVSNQETQSYFYYRHSSYPKFKITLNFNAQTRGSTCVLVPIKWETDTSPKVTAYDKVCPDTHPELFKDGEYVGDSVFPQPPKGVV